MLDLNKSQIWRGMIDASLSLFDMLEDAIDPASWPPGWEVRYTDRAPEPSALVSVSGPKLDRQTQPH